MNPWASRRRGIIFVIFFLSLLVIVGVPSYFLLQNKPDCHNSIMDGNESGVDCGGSCQLLCTPETLPLISRGEARVLKIAPATYLATVLIENPNIGGEVKRAPYTLSIYTSGVKDPVKVFNQDTYVGRNSTFAIFVGPFELAGEGPFRAVFKWGEDLVWEKSEEKLPMLSVEAINLLNSPDQAPRLEARLVNNGPRELFNIEVVALLSDVSGNTATAGKTFVDRISPGEAVPISFGWPQPFTTESVSIRILPHVLPDKSFVR